MINYLENIPAHGEVCAKSADVYSRMDVKKPAFGGLARNDRMLFFGTAWKHEEY